jgi:cephalosporin hydroxylase
MNRTALAPCETASAQSTPVARPPLFASPWSLGGIASIAPRLYNTLHRSVFSKRALSSRSKELAEIRRFAEQPSDIDEHLEMMFTETLLCGPNVIVELGVRGGASTFVFERAAALCSAALVSVDIDDCSFVSHYPQWHFVKGDDVEFASHFPEFCRMKNIVPSVDVLFIDTSHYYDHTFQEMQAWMPLMSARAKIMFHDTNMRLVGPRKDGCFQIAWDNQRGVIRSIEEYLSTEIDESKPYTECVNGWLVRHSPYCNGFTIMDRLSCNSDEVNRHGLVTKNQ